jgi:hypothetical protein
MDRFPGRLGRRSVFSFNQGCPTYPRVLPNDLSRYRSQPGGEKLPVFAFPFRPSRTCLGLGGIVKRRRGGEPRFPDGVVSGVDDRGPFTIPRDRPFAPSSSELPTATALSGRMRASRARAPSPAVRKRNSSSRLTRSSQAIEGRTLDTRSTVRRERNTPISS